ACLRPSAGWQVACRHRRTQFEFRSLWAAIERGNRSRTYDLRRGPITEMGLAEEIRFSPATLHYGQVLPQAQIDFRRTISVDRSNPVICCEEQATNLSAYDRPISWNEHVTFGPPFLECETTVFDMPATHAKVCPASYSEQIFLQPDAEFRWPNAPTKQGAPTDLRRTPDQQ